MPRDSAAADRPASYLVGTAAAFPLFFRDRAKPINQLPFSPSAKFPKSGSSCESRVKRGFLGWLRGERGHCSMVRVPTLAEEDAKRPNRERECLVKERTRLVNRIKGTLARLGIRNFKPTLRQAAERLATMHTPEGTPVPPNALAELHRDVARLSFVVGQIKQIEEARRQRLEEQPERGPHAMVRLLARVVGIGIETAEMRVNG